MCEKPSRIFDREQEWRALSMFADRDLSRPQLGVISGRRRQGKTFLVESLAETAGGLYFGATEATETESLRLFGEGLGRHLGQGLPLRFADWNEALGYLFASVHNLHGPIVIDEFPYLSKATPALPSILQRELDGGIRQQRGVSILLCGSALSVMGKLMSGNAPLRGRAALELMVRPFDYRTAAAFWGVTDPRLAVLVHSVVGGTPAYHTYINGDIPVELSDFDSWVQRTVLNPATPLLREARYLLEEDASVRDPGLYHSVLAAVAAGNNARGGIANYIGRRAADIGHHLNVLEDTGMIRREPDAFHAGRSRYQIAEPLIAFYQAIMRPRWGPLESGRAAAVWADAQTQFHSQLVGPHFEHLCREFAAAASAELFGGLPADVQSGTVTDSASQRQVQIDVVVFAPAEPGEPRRILSLGEVKWGKVFERRHVDRLNRARELLATRGFDTRDTTIALYGGTGFRGLESVVEARHVQIFPVERLYQD